jgi:arylsulfatase
MTTLDFLPTFASLAGAELSKRRLDGVDMSAFLKGEVEKSPRNEFLYYGYTHLQAVRIGKWKLVLPRPANPAWTSWYGRMMDAVPAPQLYDMSVDPEEYYDVAKSHPEVVERLMKRVKSARADLGDYNRIGAGARFFDKGPKRPDMENWKKKR